MQTRLLLPLLSLAACASPSSDWPTSTLAAEGIDPDAVASLVADIEAGTYGLTDHLLLVRHGKVVAEHHFEHDYEAISAPYEPEDHLYDYDNPRWHPYYMGSDLHTLQSVTKSITSICVGIALDEGAIPGGVETPAMNWFEAYQPDMRDARRRAMTLEDILTMRSGIQWNEQISYDDPANSCLQLEASDDWVQYVIDQPMREEPGTVFDYNSGASVLLGKIVREATGQRIDEYAREKLFEPLGITEFRWKETPCGEIDTEGGLYLAPRDLARVAQLFLQRGEWNGQRVVSAEWVQASIFPHVADVDPEGPNDLAYGYQWWVPDHEGGRTNVYMGSGYGGQFPVVVPDLDLVVVVNAWNIHEQPAQSPWGAIFRVLIPAAAGD